MITPRVVKDTAKHQWLKHIQVQTLKKAIWQQYPVRETPAHVHKEIKYKNVYCSAGKWKSPNGPLL